MKVVTIRNGKAPPLEDARILLRTIRKLQGGALVPRGVFRFANFQEADEWMIREIARTLVRRKSRIS